MILYLLFLEDLFFCFDVVVDDGGFGLFFGICNGYIVKYLLINM